MPRMHRSAFLVGVTFICWACSGEALVLDCIDGDVHLQVRPARYTIDGQVTINTRLYHYNDQPQFPGPTLRMKAGTQCRLTITNQLNARTSVGDCNFHKNDVHCPDTTNVHTHGLHVDPSEDDISVAILPGETYTYEYNIIDTHLMGTHWWHPHYHGSVNLQLHGGMHGAILVEPSDDYALPADLRALYAASQLVVLSHIYLDDTPDVEEAIFSYKDVVSDFGEMQTLQLEPEFHAGPKTFYAVNGDYQPTVQMGAGSATLLRFVQTSGFSLASVGFDGADHNCVLQLVARDGIFQYSPYLNVSRIHLPQAGRADVAVYCSTPGVYHLSLFSDLGGEVNVLMGRPDSVAQGVLMSLNVSSLLGDAVGLASSPAPLPDYLTDLTLIGSTSAIGSGYIGENNTIHMQAVDNKDSINGVQFPGFEADNPIGTLCLNRVYDVRLPPPDIGVNGYEKVAAHPYHQHIYSFQVLSGVDPTGELLRHREWRDTVPAVYHDDVLRVRFKPVDFSGMAMLHCHILQHEDEGMMAMFRVVAQDGECNSTSTGDDGDGLLGGDGVVLVLVVLGAGFVGGIVVGLVVAIYFGVRRYKSSKFEVMDPYGLGSDTFGVESDEDQL